MLTKINLGSIDNDINCFNDAHFAIWGKRWPKYVKIYKMQGENIPYIRIWFTIGSQTGIEHFLEIICMDIIQVGRNINIILYYYFYMHYVYLHRERGEA